MKLIYFIVLIVVFNACSVNCGVVGKDYFILPYNWSMTTKLEHKKYKNRVIDCTVAGNQVILSCGDTLYMDNGVRCNCKEVIIFNSKGKGTIYFK